MDDAHRPSGDMGMKDWLGTIAILISALSLLLLVVTRLLSEKATAERGAGWVAVPEQLASVRAPSFSVETIAGDTVEVPAAGRQAVVIAYITTCPYCSASIETWVDASKAMCSTTMILVSPEPVLLQESYWSSRKPASMGDCAGWIIGRPIDPGSVQVAYGFGATPTHYFVGADGVVRRVWRGVALGTRAEREFVKAFR